jgi:NADPH:quinone reductase-like Zn-dependent oxidoreductase
MAESNLCYSLDKLVKNTSELQLKMVPVTAEPGPVEVRIKVHAAGVNFYDYLMARGEYVRQRSSRKFTSCYLVTMS